MSAMVTREQDRRFWLLAALLAVVCAIGYAAAHVMETRGHVITGMNNAVVWGIPHVFAIFMIVAASGVLNVASVGSVFGQKAYKPWARLSGLLSIALLAGGLVVLMLDLGRPDRILVALTHFNFSSIFAANMFLYSGLAALVVVYLWTQFERRLEGYTRKAGVAVFVWRIVLTTGTGSIFGFLVARQAYQSAVLAPLMVVMSLGWGLAVFLLIQRAVGGGAADPELQRRLARLLALFVATALYFVAVFHLTNLYWARQVDIEAFLLRDGGAFPLLFWLGYVGAGSVVPLALLWRPGGASVDGTLAAAALVVVGAFAWLYVVIIGGESFPLEIFPGWSASSSFGDGAIATYAPSLPEFALGLGGVGFALLLTTVGVRVLDFVPAPEQA